MTYPVDDKLYNVSIRTLDLPEEAIELLARIGIENIGDCLDFLRNVPYALFTFPEGFVDAWLNHVVPRLRERGYLIDE